MTINLLKFFYTNWKSCENVGQLLKTLKDLIKFKNFEANFEKYYDKLKNSVKHFWKNLRKF